MSHLALATCTTSNLQPLPVPWLKNSKSWIQNWKTPSLAPQAASLLLAIATPCAMNPWWNVRMRVFLLFWWWWWRRRCYCLRSWTLRHCQLFVGFPVFHLSVIAGGALAGYFIGCYEAKALTQYDELVAQFKERHGSLTAEGMCNATLFWIKSCLLFVFLLSTIISTVQLGVRTFKGFYSWIQPVLIPCTMCFGGLQVV